jgi:hypothetical protein
MFVFIKNEQNVVTNVYFISAGAATEARFTPNNVIVSENEPQSPLSGDLWFDI